MKRTLISFLAIFTCIGMVQGDLISPGKYTGWLVLDRWNTMYLFDRTYVWPVSHALNQRLRALAGHPVTLDVSELSEVWDRVATIQKISNVTEVKLPEEDLLTLNFYPWDANVPLGEDTIFNLEVKYDGSKPIQFRPGALTAIVLRQASEKESKRSGRNSVVLQHRQSFNVLLAKNTVDYFEQYIDIFPFRTGGDVLETKGPFVYRTTFRRKFAPGCYQMWVAYPRTTGSPCPSFMSKVITFTVSTKTNPRRDIPYELIKSFWRAARYNDTVAAKNCVDINAINAQKDGLSFQSAFEKHRLLAEKYSFGKNLGWKYGKNSFTAEMGEEDIIYILAKDKTQQWVIVGFSYVAKR